MTTKIAPKPAAKPAAKTLTAAQRKAVQADAIAKLVAAYHEAHKQLTGKDVEVDKALSILEAAKLEQCNARVLTARAAYRLATAPGIVKADGSANQAGAAKHLGVNRTTLRHHILAGEALAKKDMILRTAKPQEDERAIVESSHDKTSRAIAKEAREAKAAREAAKLEAVATAAATGDVQAMAELMPGKSGEVVTVKAAETVTTETETETAAVVVPDDSKDMTAMSLKEILAKLATVESMVKAYRTQQGSIPQKEQDKLEDAFRDIATEAARED